MPEMSSNRPSSISGAFLQERDPTRVRPMGGSATGAAGSAPRPEPRRDFLGHRARSSSRSARIGTVTAVLPSPSGTALPIDGAVGQRGSWVSTPNRGVTRGPHRAPQLGVGRSGRPTVSEHEVGTGHQPVAVPIDLTHRSTKSPTHPVAHDGGAHAPTDGVCDPNAPGRAITVRSVL